MTVGETLYDQIERVLTDRFGIPPFATRPPQGLPALGVDFIWQDGLMQDDGDVWAMLEPAFGTLSQALARMRCGVGMWGSYWTLLVDGNRVRLDVIAEPDHVKVAEAVLGGVRHG